MMEQLPPPTYSPVNAPNVPKRPPRPVSLMSVVDEHPTSPVTDIRIRPASVWSDDEEPSVRKSSLCFKSWDSSSPPNEPPERDPRKRRWILLSVATLIVLILAAILGGVFGSNAHVRESAEPTSLGHDDGGPRSQPTESTVPPTRTDATRASTSANPATETETGDTTIHDRSGLGSGFVNPSSKGFRVVAFVSVDGELAATEWKDGGTETYAITSDDEDVELPRPVHESPIHIFSLEQNDDVHIVYVDEDLYLCLVTMSPGESRGIRSWRGGRLESGAGDPKKDSETHQTTNDLRIAFQVFTSRDNSTFDRPAGRVHILYMVNRDEDKYTLLSSIAPDDPSQWYVSTEVLREDEEPMASKAGSPGLVFIPTSDNIVQHEPGLMRILWDLSDKHRQATFRIADCEVFQETKIGRCSYHKGEWHGKPRRHLDEVNWKTCALTL